MLSPLQAEGAAGERVPKVITRAAKTKFPCRASESLDWSRSQRKDGTGLPAQLKIQTLSRGPQFFHLKEKTSAPNAGIKGDSSHRTSLARWWPARSPPRRGVAAGPSGELCAPRCSQLRSQMLGLQEERRSAQNSRRVDSSRGNGSLSLKFIFPKDKLKAWVLLLAKQSSHQQSGACPSLGLSHWKSSPSIFMGSSSGPGRGSPEPGCLSSRCLPPTAHFSRGCPSEGPGCDSGHLG